MMTMNESNRAEQQISDGEARYHDIFDSARVSIWEQDLSDTAALLDRISAERITDLRSFLGTHPATLADAIRRMRIKDVNPLRLF